MQIAVPAKNLSVTLESLTTSVVITGIASGLWQSFQTRVSTGFNYTMDRFMRKVRSSSLKKKSSKQSVAESVEHHDSIGDSLTSVEEDEVVKPKDPGLLSVSSSDTQESVIFVGELPGQGEGTIQSSSSRRSSVSNRPKNHSTQHVDFNPVEEESPISPKSTSGNSTLSPRHKAFKKHTLRSISSLASLISNTGSTKSHRRVKMSRSISSIRRTAASKAVDENFPSVRPAYVAIGCGVLMLKVVERISRMGKEGLEGVTFVSTGVASEHLLAAYSLYPIVPLGLLPQQQMIDVYFDAAEEVDDSLNCIMGKLGNLHLERMVAMRSQCFICIADHHQRVPVLFTSGVPLTIETTAESYFYVLQKLRDSGATASARGGGPAVAGPCFTERRNYVIDASWPALEDSRASVEQLASMIKGFYGVVDHSLFYGVGDSSYGRPNKVYVGLEDGAVDTLGKQSNKN